jgi:hypothetical protein
MTKKFKMKYLPPPSKIDILWTDFRILSKCPFLPERTICKWAFDLLFFSISLQFWFLRVLKLILRHICHFLSQNKDYYFPKWRAHFLDT